MSRRPKESKKPPVVPAWFLLLLAFVEGASVMACELIGARLAGPYFGSSIDVWAAVLGVTLTALMCGYYAGGYVSSKLRRRVAIFYILALAGILLIAMPPLSQWVMGATLGMSVRMGATLSLCGYMFPPLFCMGMSSPVVIHLLNERADTSGRTAGSVYAISTFGGILSTFLLGFYLMPELGLRMPALFFGGALVALSAAGLLWSGRMAGAAAAAAVAAGSALLLGAPTKMSADDTTVLEIQEGIMGQIKVVDLRGNIRALLVNNIAQTIMNRDRPDTSMSEYIFGMAAALSNFPAGSKALALGLGGGALVRHFDRFGFDTDIVEVDPRIRDVATRYFGVDPRRPIHIDDARHYLNRTGETYDIIALDLFASESPPSDLLSVEGLRETRRHLRTGGVLAINFGGRPDLPEGRATRSLIKTLRAADFDVGVMLTPNGGNVLLLASADGHDFSTVDYAEPGSSAHLQNLERHFMDLDAIDFSDAVLLDDNHARFETLYAEVALGWRSTARKLARQVFADHDLRMMR